MSENFFSKQTIADFNIKGDDGLEMSIDLLETEMYKALASENYRLALIIEKELNRRKTTM